MNARLIKETRDVLPMFAGTLLLMIVPYLIWHSNAAGFGCIAFGLTCAVLGGCAFGNEFQHRTFPLLLSQPIARSVLWRDKMLVLGGGILASLAALLVCDRAYCPAPDRMALVILALIALCAFCGTPYWTLRLRHGIGGMAFATAFPCCLLGANALVTERLSDHLPVEAISGAMLITVYCAVVYWRGYANFKRLQAVDGPSRELRLPAGLEAFSVGPLTRVGARFRSPFATLLKKEFRLQQISFLLAGLFLLIAVAGACLVKLHHGLAEAIVGFDCMIYVVILPLIAGAISVAEEKSWALAEWHLTLPPSALKQWSAKMLAALSTSLALGLLLPTALFLALQPLFSQHGAGGALPPAFAVLAWVIGFLLLTSVAVYAASLSNSTLRAILAAFGIIAASFGVVSLTGRLGSEAIRWLGLVHSTGGERVLPILCTGMFLMLCLTQWFAWSNFRRSAPPVHRVVIQLLVMFFTVAHITLAIVAALFLAQSGGR